MQTDPTVEPITDEKHLDFPGNTVSIPVFLEIPVSAHECVDPGEAIAMVCELFQDLPLVVTLGGVNVNVRAGIPINLVEQPEPCDYDEEESGEE